MRWGLIIGELGSSDGFEAGGRRHGFAGDSAHGSSPVASRGERGSRGPSAAKWEEEGERKTLVAPNPAKETAADP